MPYLYGHGVRLGRVAYDDSDIPVPSSPEMPAIGAVHTHVLLELDDYLGSTSIVVGNSHSDLPAGARLGSFAAPVAVDDGEAAIGEGTERTVDTPAALVLAGPVRV